MRVAVDVLSDGVHPAAVRAPTTAPGPARWLLVAGAIAAVQMIVVVGVDGATRSGYHSYRHWVSQLSLGPHGWIGTVNLFLCGGWLCAYGIGLRLFLGRSDVARWAVRSVFVCAAGFAAIAAVRIDPGLDYPPGIPAVHTALGFTHQAAALVVFTSGTFGAVLLGRCGSALRTGIVVAAVMVVSFVGATLLVILDVTGIVTDTPSGLLERAALYTGLGWIGFIGINIFKSISR